MTFNQIKNIIFLYNPVFDKGDLMFEQIEFLTVKPEHRLSSRFIDDTVKNDSKYGEGNLPNANFSMMFTLDSFKMPPVSEHALANLNYVQSFNIFHYEAPSYTERQNYPSFLIAYSYGGIGSLSYRGRTYTLLEKDGFFIDCREYHLYQVESGTWDVGILHLNGPLCAQIYEQFIANGSPIFHESFDGKHQHYLEKILKLYSSPQLYRDWQVSSCIDSMLTHLLMLSSRSYSEAKDIPSNITDLIRYMEKNYTEKISLDQMSAKAHINKYHLSREFKKYTGFSPNEYLISLRINAAKDLLLNTTLPACKIAFQVGIHDVNNFNALFKKRVGMTPIKFRNSGQV